jgi:TetR/AcrR family transcriptional regulator, transcriptional repressor for nem operon
MSPNVDCAGQPRGNLVLRIEKVGVNAAVDSYLSTSHRDAPTPICPLAALGSEVARSGREIKAAATEVLEKLLVTSR